MEVGGGLGGRPMDSVQREPFAHSINGTPGELPAPTRTA